MERESSNKRHEKATGFLKVIKGPKIGKVYELRGSEVIIGRVPGVNIQIKVLSVSRMHCKLIYSSGKWLVIDLRSQNGTYVNDKVVHSCVPMPLNENDTLCLGPSTTESVALHYLDCSSVVEPIMHSEKENVLIEDHPSGSSSNVSKKRKKSEKINKSRKNLRTVGPVLVESCSKRLELNDEFWKNDEHGPSVETLLDTSSNSIASLRTRISKTTGAKKKKKENVCSLSIDYKLYNCGKSFCENADLSEDQNKTLTAESANSVKNQLANVKCVLDQVFLEDDNSQSLLTTEGSLLIGSDPYPFSQPIASNPVKQLQSQNSDDLEPVISERNSELILKTQVKLLQEKILKLEETHSELEKEVAQKSELIEEFEAKESKQEKHIQELERTVKEELRSQIMKSIEEELMCNICTEILIKATVLECSHTFCEHCICEWKKKKKQCPICRTVIKSEAKVLILDHFINKILDFANPGANEKRKEILDKREELKSVPRANSRENNSRRPQRRSRRRRAAAPHRRTPSPVLVSEPDSLAENYEEFIPQSVDYFEGLPPGFDVLLEAISQTNLLDDESSVEGYGYYPGYGRCFNCGRTGHWANGCPENI